MKSTFLVAISAIILTALVFSGCNQPAVEKPAETNSANAGGTIKAGEITRTELTENAGYVMDLNIEPRAAEAGKEVVLNFAVKDKDGKPFNKLKIVHEKLMHLLIVSDDLAFFDHVHPEQQADGTFKLNYKFAEGGTYKLYADFTPENASQIVNVFNVPVGGAPRQKTALTADKEFTKTVDSLTFTMKTNGDLKAAKGTELQFYIKDASGKPVTDLEPYLGAMAHFVVISEDASKFLHVHAEEGETTKASGTGGHGDHQDQHGDMEMKVKPDSKEADTPTVRAHTEFPTGGLYKLWAQFQRGGKIFTVPFVLDIAEAEVKTAANTEIPKDAFKITVSKDGFTPGEVRLDSGKFTKIAFHRTDSKNCGGEVVFKDLNISKKLPVGEVVMVDLPADAKGKTLNFACGMDMMKGKIIVQ